MAPDCRRRTRDIRTLCRWRRARSALFECRTRMGAQRTAGSCVLARPILAPLELRFTWRLSLERAGRHGTSRFVRRNHDALARHEMVDELERAGLLRPVEDALARAKHDGEGHQDQPVD